jgi:acetoin utilization deacetylase AcuC-like enzyme
VLFVTDPAYVDHVAGVRHPERPERLSAVLEGAQRAALGDELVPIAPREATRGELERVHDAGYVDALERLCAQGGGRLDPDTAVVPESFTAALLAAGAGLAAIDELQRSDASAAFCAVRPPGHHAMPDSAMGFCLFNNIAVTAAELAARRERVLVVDYKAHHGNGTQATFENDPGVVYVSMHEYPLYPGTGALGDVGTGPGVGATINLPFPAGTTGDVYRAAVESVVVPAAEAFEPTWLLLSAGFDAHQADPLTGLGLTAGDFADLTHELAGLVPRGRCIAFLEGGYHLEALARSTQACLTALAGAPERPESPSSGGPGADVVDSVVKIRRQLADP